MTLTPLYSPASAHAAYQLRYLWTGWPSDRGFLHRPVEILGTISPLWEVDGIRLLEHDWQRDRLQLTLSVTPNVSPVTLAARLKGRIAYALRQTRHNIPFSRKVAVRSIGDATRRNVEAYIERQVGKERFVDPRFESTLAEFTFVDRQVDLSLPGESARGRYWNNLHLVLVVAERGRFTQRKALATLRDGCLKIAAKKEHWISRLAVMPDHLHVALRARPEEPACEVAYAYQNNLAYLFGQKAIWMESFYAGTFGEYNMNVVRQRIRQGARSDA